MCGLYVSDWVGFIKNEGPRTDMRNRPCREGGIVLRGGIDPTGGCVSLDATFNLGCLARRRPDRPECATTLGAAELLMSAELTGLARFFSRAVASSSRPSPGRLARQSKTLPSCPPTFSSMAAGAWYVLVGRGSGTKWGILPRVAVSCTGGSVVRAPLLTDERSHSLGPLPPQITALAFGLAITVLAFATGHLSGAWGHNMG